MFRVSLFLSIALTLNATFIPYNINPKNKQLSHIKILESYELKYNGMSELSALAYKKGMLYALSDKGILYKFALEIQKNHIKKLQLLETHPLVLKQKKIDSEGMVALKKGLLISFEREAKVRYFTFDGKKKKLKKRFKLPKALQEKKDYVSSNKMLESLSYIKEYGVISAPEKPFIKGNHIIYSKKKQWNVKNFGSLSAIEPITPHKLLLLQREFSFLTQHRVLTLIQLDLKKNSSKILAQLNSDDEWRLDNFEGLTKVSKNLYLMVSDDNDSFLQKTLLVLFKII